VTGHRWRIRHRTERAAVSEHTTDEIVVEWEPSLCIHSGNCVSSLPGGFDTRKRPWVNVRDASATEVERAVAGCPSGALRSHRP
jgi:uncharacterized Fe-S cluster protein YjdI